MGYPFKKICHVNFSWYILFLLQQQQKTGRVAEWLGKGLQGLLQ